MGDIGPRKGRLDHLTGCAYIFLGAILPIVRRLPPQPGGFLLRRLDIRRIVPLRILHRRRRGRLHRPFVGAQKGHEVGLFENLDLAARGMPYCRLVQCPQHRIAPGLAQHAGMHHVIGYPVMNVGTAHQLRRQILAGHILSDNAVFAGRLRRRRARGRQAPINFRRHAPIRNVRGRAIHEKTAILHRYLLGATIQAQGRTGHQQCPRLGTDQTDRGTGNHDRQRR